MHGEVVMKENVASLEKGGLDDFSDLEEMFGKVDSKVNNAEDVISKQNLAGFACCFPTWDLHPPVNM